jgi:hypothetical protein
MYKELFNTAVLLIFRPSEAWSQLKEKKGESDELFLTRYLYPFIGLMTLAAFVAVLFTRSEFSFELALKSAIVVLLATLGAYWFASSLLKVGMERFLRCNESISVCRRFTGYASAAIFALNIVLSFFPSFFMLRFMAVYTLYIVWEGAQSGYFNLQEADYTKFTIGATLIIALSPWLLEKALFILMPGLRSVVT